MFFILLFSLAGIILTIYLTTKKNSAKPLICPMKGNCSDVIQSKFSKIFGIPVEILGLLYYLVIFFGYGIYFIAPTIMPELVMLALFISSAGAVLFSFYLTTIQLFVLKKICTWCLFSALLCLLIFIFAWNINSLDLLGTFLVDVMGIEFYS